jgi:hypothetical protein
VRTSGSVRAVRLSLLAIGVVVSTVGGCAPRIEAAVATGATPSTSPAPVAVTQTPDVEVKQPDAATVSGGNVPFDGGPKDELAWPALKKVLERPPGDATPVTIQVLRTIPVLTVLRAVGAARGRDVRLQSLDGAGMMRVVELKASGTATPQAKSCHLAAMLQRDGSIHLWTPAGARSLTGENPTQSLTHLLELERAHCPLRYVAFGSPEDAPFGPLFDVIAEVDRTKSAGDARYVMAAP